MKKITITYHRVTKTKPKVTTSDTVEYHIGEYSEQLILDGETETLEHIQHLSSDCVISRKYNVQDGISALMDSLDMDRLFVNTAGNTPDVIIDPLETRDYELMMEFKDRYALSIKGSFDINGLPDGFPKFAEAMLAFMNSYGTSEILNPSVYNKAKRKTNDYIFYSVKFETGGISYYYQSENDTLEIGDLVWVPVGDSNRPTVVKIVNIEYFQEDKVPFALDKVKHIIRRCAEDYPHSPSHYDKAPATVKFFCPVYDGDISQFDCDEIYYGAQLGGAPNYGIPFLMDTEIIEKKRELCIACKNLKNALEKSTDSNN